MIQLVNMKLLHLQHNTVKPSFSLGDNADVGVRSAHPLQNV